jgi:hypothetical protein
MCHMHVTHAIYLQVVMLPTFQARHFQVFSGMILALILIVDPMFFRSFCSQKNILYHLAISEFFTLQLYIVVEYCNRARSS